jgi:nitrate/nitrite transporter NarK
MSNSRLERLAPLSGALTAVLILAGAINGAPFEYLPSAERNEMGAINGAMGASFGAGAAVFPLLAGFIFDQTGDYSAAFIIASLAILASTAATWIAPITLSKLSKSQTIRG